MIIVILPEENDNERILNQIIKFNKMKKILAIMTMLLMVSALSFVVSSCGDDDDDSGYGSGVVGTWSANDDGEYLTLTFKKDGTGTWTERYYDYDSGKETERGSFSYEMEGKSKGIMTIRTYDSYYGYETEHMYFEIEGKKMYLFEDYYGEDLEWILTKE